VQQVRNSSRRSLHCFFVAAGLAPALTLDGAGGGVPDLPIILASGADRSMSKDTSCLKISSHQGHVDYDETMDAVVATLSGRATSDGDWEVVKDRSASEIHTVEQFI